MNYGLIVGFILLFINLLIYAYEHGKPKEGINSFWSGFFTSILTVVLFLWIAGWSLK